MEKTMQDLIGQEQPNLNYGERINSLLELYFKGLIYFAVLMRGLSQMSIFLLGNYAQPGSFASSHNQHNGFLKLPTSPVEPSEGRPIDGKASLNSQEGVLSSVRQLMEDYFSKNAPSVLQTLMEFMCLAYSSNSELRKHIKNIHAGYHFSFRDHDTQISLQIKNGGMRVFRGNIDLPNVSLEFRDSNALRKLLFSAKPDLLEMILMQDIVTDGNLVYMFKFAYLVRHLQMKLMGSV